MTTKNYEPPQAIRLTDADRAFGTCTGGSTAETGGGCLEGQTAKGFRKNDFSGVCITGKSPTLGCYAGVGCGSGSNG